MEKLPSNKLLVIDTEGLTSDTRFNSELPLYTICMLEVDDKGKQKLYHSKNVRSAIAFIEQKLQSGYALIGHNLKFDLCVLESRGLKVPSSALLICTLQMAYVKNTAAVGKLSLDALTGKKLHIIEEFEKHGVFENTTKPTSLEQFWAIDWTNNPKAIKLITKYCLQDVKATYSLYKKLAAWFNAHPKFLKSLLKIELPMLRVLTQLEQNGIYVSPQRLQALMLDLEEELTKAKNQITNRYPRLPKLKWHAEKQEFVPHEVLYKRGYYRNKRNLAYYMEANGKTVASDPYYLGDHCPLVPFNASAATGHIWWVLKKDAPAALEKADKTPQGRPKLNKTFFAAVADELPPHLPLATIIKCTKLLDLCNTLRKHIHKDGRIHCNFVSARTRTTRLASNSPNLQNMPRPWDDKHPDYRTPKDYGMRFRQLFCAPPGKRILVADLDRIEVVVLAWFLANVTKDDKLLKIINSGEDVHTANANNWGISRSLAKTVLFLLIYGGSANLIYKRGLTPTLEEAQRVFDQVHSSQPSIAKLKDLCWSTARKRAKVDGMPWVSNPFGARGVYPELLSENKWERFKGERMSFNFIIQKTARDVLHLLLIESLPCVKQAGASFVNIIHDEAIVEVDEDKAPQLLQDLNKIWNNRYDILPGVCINGEWHDGESWFEAK